MRTFLKILLSFTISIVCLYFATRNVDWAKLKEFITNIKFMPLLIGMCISLVTYWIRALRWQLLLNPFQKISTFILLRWQIGGLLISNLVPLRIGELARAYWAGHKSSISKSSIFATIVIERSMDVLSLAVIAAILFLVMGLANISDHLTTRNIVIGILIIPALILGFKFLLKHYKLKDLLSKLQNILPSRLFSMIERFISGLKILQDKKEIFKVILLSSIIWMIDISALTVIALSLDLKLTWMQGGLTMVGLILGVMVPAAPGSAGTYEAGGVAALTMMGFEKTLSLSFVFILHAFQYIMVILMGIPVLMIEGFSPKKFYEDARVGQT